MGAKKKAVRKKVAKKAKRAKKAPKKSMKKASSGSLAMLDAEPAMATGPVPENTKTAQAWRFSRHADHRYVPTTTSWPQFRDGLTTLLVFHATPMPAPARELEIEKFAAELDSWMLDVRYGGLADAQKRIRAAVEKPDKPLADLLRVVDAAYIKEEEE